jgi:hypothetical protein
MLLQTIELEEVQMTQVSDEALEDTVTNRAAATLVTGCWNLYSCPGA